MFEIPGRGDVLFCHATPRNDTETDADLGLLRPAPDEIHYLVPHVMRHPVAG